MTTHLNRLAGLRLVLAIVSFLFTMAASADQKQAFTFDLSGEQETIGDLKPTFVVYKDKELPDVSIEYVMKRYVKLFESTKAPDVKVDALNRINNLSATYGVSGKKLSIDKVAQSQAVLDSYDSIVDSGVFYERMDELLYQTAKASAFVGNPEESIKRLKLLVGLYPRSPLVDESVFRIAEAYFDLGEYADAEAQYKKLLAFAQSDEFHKRARFKLGWSVFRQDRYQEAAVNAFEVLSEHPELEWQTSFMSAPEEEHDFIEDTLRLLAILYSKEEGVDSLEASQKKLGKKVYAYLLYDALFRFYLRQERFEESAKVGAAYAARYNERFEAYAMALNAIKAYQKGKFDIQTWTAKEDFAANFGVNSHYWRSRSVAERKELEPHLLSYGEELAHLYYTRMQKERGKNEQEHREFGTRASDYYLDLTTLMPDSERNGHYVFLAAEASREILDLSKAISLYERSAYQEQAHEQSENSAYAAIISFDELAGIAPLESSQIKRKSDNILRFAEGFSESARTPELLNYLSGTYFGEGAFSLALEQALRVLEHDKTKPEARYSSLLIAAHSTFELGAYNQSETYYRRALKDPGSKQESQELRERLALSIYRQAENTPDLLASANLYLKVVDTVPESDIVAQALYDASAQFLSAQAWGEAIASLSHFQSAYPAHELFSDSNEKLVYAYQESGDWSSAAEKLVEMSANEPDSGVATARYLTAAQYYEQSGFSNEAVEIYKLLTERYSAMFDLSIDAYARIVSYYQAYDALAAIKWKKKVINYEAENSDKRTQQSAALAGGFAYDFALAEVDAFNEAKLTLPLKQSLATKKKKLAKAVKSMEGVAAYKVSDLQSAATYQIGRLYQTLARDLLASERPSTLNELQLEQYDILLEEQAYPFEEQAIELYELNAEKTALGLYDPWIKDSLETLARVNPGLYKRETKRPGYASEIF